MVGRRIDQMYGRNEERKMRGVDVKSSQMQNITYPQFWNVDIIAPAKKPAKM